MFKNLYTVAHVISSARDLIAIGLPRTQQSSGSISHNGDMCHSTSGDVLSHLWLQVGFEFFFEFEPKTRQTKPDSNWLSVKIGFCSLLSMYIKFSKLYFIIIIINWIDLYYINNCWLIDLCFVFFNWKNWLNSHCTLLVTD